MTKELVTYQDVKNMAVDVYKSQLFGLKSPEQVVTLMLVAQAEGKHPMEALARYHVIEGKPSKKARVIQADFIKAGGKIRWIQRNDTCVEAEFTHPTSPEPLKVRWDIERATKAGLWGKPNWQKYSCQMFTARVISEGVTTIYPEATGIICYTPEEVVDFNDNHTDLPEITQETVTEGEIIPDPAPAPESPSKSRPVADVLGFNGQELYTPFKRLLGDLFEAKKSLVDGMLLKRGPVYTLEYAERAYCSRYSERYLHAVKEEASCPDEVYRKILAKYDCEKDGIPSSKHCVSLAQADTIASAIKNWRDE